MKSPQRQLPQSLQPLIFLKFFGIIFIEGKKKIGQNPTTYFPFSSSNDGRNVCFFYTPKKGGIFQMDSFSEEEVSFDYDWLTRQDY